MSPKVGITISAQGLAELLKTPRLRVLEALAQARARRLPLRRGEAGVVWGLAGWHVDRQLQPNGVSLLGAVLLHMQPEPEGDEDPVASAARALDVTQAWVEGLQDGWDGEPAATAHHEYLGGHEVGLAARAALGTGAERQ